MASKTRPAPELALPADITIDDDQPPRGSVVMTQGPTGTAWQRFHSDGNYHSTTGLVRTWSGIHAAGRVTLVYRAEEQA